MSEQPEVLVERRGSLGVLTLNRPRAINALTHGMVRTIAAALDEYESDDAVATVLITGAGERGLCAGGDIVALHADARTGDHSAAAAFWADEYRLNARLASYPKPTVAIQDGIVLGGGIGISAHCAYRVVTDRSRLGLPEVGIGFVPDVGATWLLSRSPGELGTAVALTARNADAGDAIALGLSDAFVPSERIPRLIEALESDDPAAALAALSNSAPDSALAAERHWIDEVFAGDDPSAIAERLAAAGEPAASFVTALARVSPTAVAVTLAALRRAAQLTSLPEVLVQEYRVSMHALGQPDFAEGVRAQVIDKDRSPAWTPPSLPLVDPDDVATYFRPPALGDLQLSSKEMA